MTIRPIPTRPGYYTANEVIIIKAASSMDAACQLIRAMITQRDKPALLRVQAS